MKKNWLIKENAPFKALKYVGTEMFCGIIIDKKKLLWLWVWILIFLWHHDKIYIFRLQKSTLMGDLTEVPVPTKFLFFLLGPVGQQSRHHEIGRSIATLMSDEVRSSWTTE